MKVWVVTTVTNKSTIIELVTESLPAALDRVSILYDANYKNNKGRYTGMFSIDIPIPAGHNVLMR